MKNCIICNQNKCRIDSRKLHTCETRRAKQFLFAIKFNKDEVFTRLIFYKITGGIFAADVMYHKNCMTNYILKFQRHVSEILDDNDDQCDHSIIEELFLEIVATLKLDKEDYTVSDCRDTLNSNLRKARFGKRSLFYLVFLSSHIFSAARLSIKSPCYCSMIHV